MTHSIIDTVKALAVAGAVLVVPQGAVAQSNLTPLFNPFSGQVSVQNTGAQFAAPTWVTIECNLDCPTPPAAQIGPYLNPGFVNLLSLNVPLLGGFQSFNHGLPFWGGLNFPTGTAVFTVCADAAGTLAESSERDNCVQVLRRQKAPKVNVAVPKPRLRLKQ